MVRIGDVDSLHGQQSAQDWYSEEMPNADAEFPRTDHMSLKLLNNQEAAERLGIKPDTLRIWRMQGKGPHFRKIGSLVRYAESDVTAYVDASTRISTSQKAPAQAALA
jgi:predicted DNA-binding transcriptional regulator AlpA